MRLIHFRSSGRLHDIRVGELMELGEALVFGGGRRIPHGVLNQGEHPPRLKVGDLFEDIEDLAANGVRGRTEVVLDAVPDGGKEVGLFAGRVLDPPVEFRQVAKHLRQANRRELLVHRCAKPVSRPRGFDKPCAAHGSRVHRGRYAVSSHGVGESRAAQGR